MLQFDATDRFIILVKTNSNDKEIAWYSCDGFAQIGSGELRLARPKWLTLYGCIRNEQQSDYRGPVDSKKNFVREDRSDFDEVGKWVVGSGQRPIRWKGKRKRFELKFQFTETVRAGHRDALVSHSTPSRMAEPE